MGNWVKEVGSPMEWKKEKMRTTETLKGGRERVISLIG